MMKMFIFKCADGSYHLWEQDTYFSYAKLNFRQSISFAVVASWVCMHATNGLNI